MIPHRPEQDGHADVRWRTLGEIAVPVPLAAAATGYVVLAARPSLVEVGVVLASLLVPGLTGSVLAQRERRQLEPAAIPAQTQKLVFLVALSAIVIAPLALAILCGTEWLDLRLLRPVAVAAAAYVLSCGLVAYYVARRRVAVDGAAAADAPGAEPEAVPRAGVEPAQAVRGLARRRLQIALVTPALLGMVLVLDFASREARHLSDADRIAWAVRATRALARTDAELPLAERIEATLPAASLRPARMQSAIVDPEALGGPELLDFSPEFLAALDRGLRGGRSDGPVQPRTGADVGAYRFQPDGSVLVIGVARDDRSVSSAAVVLVLCALCVLLFGLLVASDLGRSIDRLRKRAGPRAGAGLAVPAAPIGDDEFAALERELDAFADTMASAAAENAAIATRVDATIAELTEAVGGIGEGSVSQTHALEQARRLIAQIGGRVGEASETVVELDQTIDESASFVQELGATGEELNQTASVLTSKVDAVSDSIEQMVGSVKAVGATTDRLAEASEETSSSMEEMASAMRAVDTAAESTASLSRDVIDKAELGQAKVAQTIEGMEAIRQATDTAERVIRGLGDRTREIGGILDVIDDVADETNLLALNAAIIAAQAGEQGKAFSVVAEEIKELADRVLASTKEIGGLIRAVQEESENAVGAIEAGSASVMSGVDLSAEAGRTLEEITEASRESGTRISEIVNSVREQTKAASHVVGLMERVRDSADQIGAASVQQDRGNEIVFRSTLTMREVAQQVRRTTEDQAAGFGRIRENVIGVRGAVATISEALQAQTASCGDVERQLDDASGQGQRSAEAARRVREGLAALAEEAGRLRENASRLGG